MKHYKQLKNHIHNTLDISKEEIREMVEQAITNIVERRVDVLLRDKLSLDSLVDQAISRKITQNNWFWGESEDSLDDHIKKEVVDRLLKGVKLKVEVTGRKADATPTYQKAKIKRTVRKTK